VQPAINFYWGPEMDKEDKPDNKGKTPKPTDQHRVFDVPLDPKKNDKSDTYEIRVKTFRTSTPEEWCCLQEQVFSDQSPDIRTCDKMAEILTPLYAAVLEGHAICKFEEQMSLNAAKDVRVCLTVALNEIAKGVFDNPMEAYTIQKRYLKKSGLRMWKLKPSEFGHHLEMVNSYLEYFPRRESDTGDLIQNKPLPEDELLEILDEAQPSAIQKLMIANKDSVMKYDWFNKFLSILDGWYEANGLQVALVEFQLPELSNRKKVTWLSCHVDDCESPDKDWAIYDIILGMDIMTKIGLSVNTAEKCITWEQSSMPLKRWGALQSQYICHQTYGLSVVAPVLQEAEEHQSQILEKSI
jgi:hypothetical protein